MAIQMNEIDRDYGVEAVAEMTLTKAISRLNEVAWKLSGLVFGEGQNTLSADKSPIAPSKIIKARDDVQDVTRRLEDVARQLELLGK